LDADGSPHTTRSRSTIATTPRLAAVLLPMMGIARNPVLARAAHELKFLHSPSRYQEHRRWTMTFRTICWLTCAP
jgi:hypothetical protein